MNQKQINHLAMKNFLLPEGVCISAADPGLKGAVSFLFNPEGTKNRLITYAMPISKGVVDVVRLSKIVSMFMPKFVFIEDCFVGANANTAMISGKNWGRLAAAYECHGIPITAIHNSTWKAEMLSKKIEKGDEKIRAAEAARFFFPEIDFQGHDGRIDAGLINLYAAYFGKVLTCN